MEKEHKEETNQEENKVAAFVAKDGILYIRCPEETIPFRASDISYIKMTVDENNLPVGHIAVYLERDNVTFWVPADNVDMDAETIAGNLGKECQMTDMAKVVQII